MNDGFAGIAASPDRRLYPCGDGRFISVAAAEPRTWGALCDGIGRSDLSDRLGVKGADADAVIAELTAIFMSQPASYWVEKLGPTGAAVNPVNAGADIVSDPQIVARGGVRQLNGEPVPANPIRMTSRDGVATGTDLTPPGKVGDFSEAALSRAGFAADEIAAMRAEGLI
jgi:crotonobetainyl-CoA:carnitine CoA-transferase CaiB-like acyl-CoA transferase